MSEKNDKAFPRFSTGDFFRDLNEIEDFQHPCDNCGKHKETTRMKRGTEWKHICSSCEMSTRPYLKDTPEVKTERFGSVVIHTRIKDGGPKKR